MPRDTDKIHQSKILYLTVPYFTSIADTVAKELRRTRSQANSKDLIQLGNIVRYCMSAELQYILILGSIPNGANQMVEL